MKRFFASFISLSLLFSILPPTSHVFAQDGASQSAQVSSEELGNTREPESTQVETEGVEPSPTNASIETPESEPDRDLVNDPASGEDLDDIDSTEEEVNDADAGEEKQATDELSDGMNPNFIDPPPIPEGEYTPPSPTTDPKTFLSSFQGSSEVSLFSGALNYGFPIWVPQGRLGMTPSINLNYSSTDTRFAGPVGYGWSLPTNAVYRVQRDGYDKIYDQDDYFGVDIFGSQQEIMVTDAEAGLYRSKHGGDAMSYIYDDQSDSWTVKDAQGTTYTFGTTLQTKQVDPADASKVYKWMLERVEDVNGNFMTLAYEQHGNAVYPDKIRYTGFENDVGIFEIDFVLEDRSDGYTDYKTAFEVEYAKQVDRIDLISYQTGQPDTRLSYDLNYKNHSAAITLLESITVQAGGETLPSTNFSYFDGGEADEFKKLHVLKQIDLPYGGSNTFTYQPATAYREPDSTSSNWLPFVTFTVKSKSVTAGQGEPVNTTTYDYRRGHYYFDDLDAYKREYAGFGEVTVTDPVGNQQKLYFHQSEFDSNNFEDSLRGEFEDHIAKKGRVYRQELYDDQDQIRQEVITQYDAVLMPQGDSPEPRLRVFEAQSVQVEHGEDQSTKTRATATVEMDDYGNLLEMKDYGEVELVDPSGLFNDVGDDLLRTVLTYSQNPSNHLFSGLKTSTTFDQANDTIADARIYYDGLPLGQIEKGNWTSQERWVDEKTMISSSKSYSPEGLTETVTNPRGYATQVIYDEFGLFPVIVENALGHQMSYVYDPFFGAALSMTDPNGHDTLSELDVFGRLSQSYAEDTNGQMQLSQTTIYDLEATPVTLTQENHLGYQDVNNQPIIVTQKTYFDGLSRSIQTKQEAEGNNFIVSSQVYDERGQVSESYLPQFTQTPEFEPIDVSDPKITYTYDALGQVKTEANDLGSSSMTYNAWHQVVTDANGNQKAFYKDARGNLIQVDEFNGNQVYTTTYDYDSSSNLNKITDAEGNIRTTTHDWLGRPLTQTLLHHPDEPNPSTLTMSYDENGNLLTRTDAKGQTLTFDYDPLDRMLSSVSEEDVITYTYDGKQAMGRLWKVDSKAFQKQFEYDLLGRLVQELKTLPYGGDFLTQFEYVGLTENLSSILYPDGLEVGYQYDNAGQMEQVPGYVESIEYSPIGSVAQVDYANGMITTSVYAPDQLWRMTDRVTTDGQTNLQSVSYVYDPVGNILQITDASDSILAKTSSYTYDDLDRLMSATVVDSADENDYIRTFTYSPTGNILNKSDLGSYIYEDKHPQAVTGVGSDYFVYDANGSLTEENEAYYLYDERGQMSFSKGGSAAVYYFYDESGERLNKLFDDNHAQAYVNQYYEAEVLKGELVDSSRYVYVGPLKVATVGSDDVVAFHHEDHLSGASVTTGENGQVLELVDYYPYGEVRIEQKNEGYENDYLYTGQERDEETDLMYYGARYYDPVVGRFMSVDPWGGDLSNPQTLNKYAYVVNNPLKYVDPTGEYAQLFSSAARALPAINQAAQKTGQMVADGAAVLLGVLSLTKSTTVVIEEPQAKEPYINNPPPQPKVEPYVFPVADPLPVFTPDIPVEIPMSTPLIFPDTPPSTDITSHQGVCGGNMSCADAIFIGGYGLSDHALEQMNERNITQEQIENAINQGESFSYWGDRIGYYDKETNVFVGTGDKITTVINPRNKEQYVENKKNEASPPTN